MNEQLRQQLRARMVELCANAESFHEDYASAKPYPHMIIDDFLPEEVAEQIWQDFPPKGDKRWHALGTDDQRNKFTCADEDTYPESIRAVIAELNSGSFVRFLEKATGIDNIIVDATMMGGGLHRIEKGGKLNVHVDFSHHPENGLHRRLNLLIYLNKDWEKEYGGAFEMWRINKKDKKCLKKAYPVFNRCVVFSTSPTSYHGHPEPLTCPDDMARQSIALYYFTSTRPAHEAQEHNTHFVSRPDEKVSLSTHFVRFASSGIIRDLLPPIVFKAIRTAWNKNAAAKK